MTSLQKHLTPFTPATVTNAPIDKLSGIAKGVGAAAGIGLKALEDRQNKNLEAAVSDMIDQETEQFLAARSALGELPGAEAREVAAVEQLEAESVFGTATEEADINYRKARDEVSALSARLNQGAKTTSEFRIGVSVKIKDLMNRFPGKTEEIRTLARGLLGDISPILDAVAAQERTQQANAAAAQKAFSDLVQDAGGMPPLGGTFEDYYAENIALAQMHQMNEQLKLRGDLVSNKTKVDLLTKGELVSGALFTTNTQLDAITSNTQLSGEQKVFAIQQRIFAAKEALALQYNGATDHQRYKDATTALDTMLQQYTDIATGKMSADVAGNMRDLVNAQTEISLFGDPLLKLWMGVPEMYSLLRQNNSPIAEDLGTSLIQRLGNIAGTGRIPPGDPTSRQQNVQVAYESLVAMTAAPHLFAEGDAHTMAMRANTYTALINGLDSDTMTDKTQIKTTLAMGAKPMVKAWYDEGGVDKTAVTDSLDQYQAELLQSLRANFDPNTMEVTQNPDGSWRVINNGATVDKMTKTRNALNLYGFLQKTRENLLGEDLTTSSGRVYNIAPGRVPSPSPRSSSTGAVRPPQPAATGVVNRNPQPAPQLTPVIDPPVAAATPVVQLNTPTAPVAPVEIPQPTEEDLDGLDAILGQVKVDPNAAPEVQIQALKDAGATRGQVMALAAQFGAQSLVRERLIQAIEAIYGQG